MPRPRHRPSCLNLWHGFPGRAALKSHVPVLGPDLDCLVVLDADATVFQAARGILVQSGAGDITKHDHAQVIAGLNTDLALLVLEEKDELDRLLE